MLSVRHLTVTHQKDLRTLISDLSFTVSGTDHLALIGEEGNGKSTLLKLIYDEAQGLEYCEYTGAIDRGGEVFGYLAQEIPPALRRKPVYTFCAAHDAFLNMDFKALNALCADLRLDTALCYSDRPVDSLSGGERIKLQLLLILCKHPTMLLLDEPSNDLDLAGLRFLEQFILHCQLPVIYISHDEKLLARTATSILHLEMAHHKNEPRWTLANMPYLQYMEERSQAIQRQESAALMERREARAQQQRFERIQQAVEHAQATVSRQDPSTGRLLKKKMKAVKSLEHRYEREKARQTERPNIEYALDASYVGHHSVPEGKRMLELHLPVLRAGDSILAENLSLEMTGPEKVLLIGRNGCGKTTLLQHIWNQQKARKDILPFYMPQQYEDVLSMHLTPIQYLHTTGEKDQLTRLRTFLGAFKFTAEEMTHPIQALSGGQKAKLLWLRVILSDANFLILDEPTRNLSPLSSPVIRKLICTFAGAVVAVTHDRTLIENWPGRVMKMDRDGLRPLSRQETARL